MAAATQKQTTGGIRTKLLEMLGDVNRPGDYCTFGDLPVTMPGLDVDGVGPIGLPLTKTQARELIKQCRQAPYGKGTETVVDTDVRRVWELDPDRFELSNPEWETFVDSVLVDVKQKLGLEKCKLSAHLYKLLVYEEGGFFLPHRDGEKLDGMVATLVIALPSVHEGGELVVSHDGRETTIPSSGARSGLEMSYAAFYADCEHEVRPVTSGYRLSLAYNVTLDKTRGKSVVAAPSYGGTAAAVGELFNDWSRNSEPDEKLVVTLDHRYTQDGLSIDLLKGVDRARADVLFDAAEMAGCVAHLALVTLWKSGLAEGYEEDYRWGRSYDPYEDDDGTVSDRVMGEVYDESLSAAHWTDRKGRKVSIGEIGLSETEIVSSAPPEEWEADREDFEGYTGNAGMTLERWYHRAAVVVWPRDRHYDLLCQAGTAEAIGSLEVMIEELNDADESHQDELRRECITFAAAIIDSWQHPGGGWNHWRSADDDADLNVFPGLLCDLDAAGLLGKFLASAAPRDGRVQFDESFVEFCKQREWKVFETELVELVQTATSGTVLRNAQLVELLSVRRDKNADRIKLCKNLCGEAVVGLIAFDEADDERDWEAKRLDRTAILTSLVKAALAVGANDALKRLVEHTWAAQDKYDLTDAHLKAVFALESKLKKQSSRLPAISHWIELCRDELAARTAVEPQPPEDHRRDNEISCDCEDCRKLSVFLADPHEEQLRLPVKKERRRHLHGVINNNRLDLTHETERRGSPHTLVCTKTTASHDAAVEIYQRDLKNLKRIQKLL